MTNALSRLTKNSNVTNLHPKTPRAYPNALGELVLDPRRCNVQTDARRELSYIVAQWFWTHS